MDIDATYLPVAVELIDNVFPTPIVYLLTAPPAYDPSTGESTSNVTEYQINAGILSRGKSEGGGVDAAYELRLWIHHDVNGLPALPTTADRVLYDETFWKVVRVDPTYSSDNLIASRLTVWAE